MYYDSKLTPALQGGYSDSVANPRDFLMLFTEFSMQNSVSISAKSYKIGHQS